MHVPTLERAEAYLRDAERRNPGPWVPHSRYVAEAARAIASRCAGLDPGEANVLGLLHDIGRRDGPMAQRHIYTGYGFMMAEGYPDVARICLTHSFPVKVPAAQSGVWDCDADATRFVDAFIARTEYDDYDRLLQLCDALALPTGFCLVEKRLVDSFLRYGPALVNAHTAVKWKGYLDLVDYFTRLTGGSIYRLLNGVIENTFGFGPAA